MYENIISIYNILKKKTTYLNFQPAQYLKKLTKIILNQKNLKKKEKKKKKKSILGKKKRKKKHVKNKNPAIQRVLEFFNIILKRSL
jgi:ABC-type transport system involved in cytochrome bd biosynthesis fused ATPase/permease subunit